MVVAPQVSVVVPAYNVCSYIEQALVSLERQSFQDFEALVVDDGSTDGTVEVVKPFEERDSRFRLLHKHNGGLSSAHNYDIRHTCTQYIALLDVDDTDEPDKLAIHVALLDRIPKIGIVYCTLDALSSNSWQLLD